MSSTYALIDKATDEILNIIECSEENISGFITENQYAVKVNTADTDNYPPVGGLYKKENNKFVYKVDQYGTKPWPSWSLDDRNRWKAPIPYPTDGEYYGWDEENQKWFRWNP
jgi:hypothetical protein